MVSNAVWFYSLLILLIPSFFCLLFVLYNLLFDRTLRHGLHNHIIIIILFIDLVYEITVYPWMIYYYYNDGFWKRSIIFCEIWTFLDWGSFITHIIYFAWATIERHILIFHDQWLSTRKKRLFIHYFPLFILFLYCFLYFFIVNFFPSCENFIVDSSTACSSICMYDIYIFIMYDMIVHQLLPIFLVVVFSIALLVRILWQNHRIHRRIQWRKQRKMTVQLLSISLLYIIFVLPFAIYLMLRLLNMSSDVFYELALYINYFMLPIFPFVCALSLSELRNKFIQFLSLRQKARRIAPDMLPMGCPVATQRHNR